MHFGARVVTGARISDHIPPTVEALGWRSMTDFVTHRDTRDVFRALSDLRAPEAICSLFTIRATVSQRETRATLSGALELPAYRPSTSRRTFSYRTASSWSNLSQDPAGSQVPPMHRSAVYSKRW